MYQNNKISSDINNININEEQFLNFFERVISDNSQQSQSSHSNPSGTPQLYPQQQQQQQLQLQQQQQTHLSSGIAQPQPTNSPFQVPINPEGDFGVVDFNYGYDSNIPPHHGKMVLQQPTPNSVVSSNSTIAINPNTLRAFAGGIPSSSAISQVPSLQNEKTESNSTMYSSISSTVSNRGQLVTPESDSNSECGSSVRSDTMMLPEAKLDTQGKVGKPKKRKKTSHNIIEKKYRHNINDKIAQLRDLVPTISLAHKEYLKIPIEQQDIINLDGLEPTHKLNKGSVLSKTIEYIKHLQKRCDEFKTRNELLEKHVVKYVPVQESSNTQPNSMYIERDQNDMYH
ncbi:Hms1 protein [Maudiozyma humilis]|uniref:Hms1 protein n=1 Tax=Maudiozyma humilis TaxID=51915 RepID=A0AAV5RRW5_MAUHU|nr:Hms1 protein [Kazachstania humilis]